MTDRLDEVRRIMDAPEDVDPGDVEMPPAPDPEPRGDDWTPEPPPRDAPPDGPDGPPGDGEDPPEKAAAAFPLNDVGNGRRFVTYYGEDVLFVPRVGWFTWSGRAWELDPDGLAVRRRAQTVSERMVREIEHLALEDWQRRALDALPAARAALARSDGMAEASGEDQAARDAAIEAIAKAERVKRFLAKAKSDHRTFAKSTGNTAKIKAMLSEAEPALAHAHDALDAEELAVNCLSGTLRFDVDRGPDGTAEPVARVRVCPHDRTDLISKEMPVEYESEADAPRFEAFLLRILPDPDVRAFVQRWLGLSLTARPEQRLALFYGTGANGKSVLVDLVARVIGSYAATAKIESLTGQGRRGGGDATPDLVPLMGARMVRASEPEQGERLKEGTIKELTGGEPILVRALNQDFVAVTPHFKLTISGNHKPDIRGTDYGIWRRVMLVPFEVQIPEEERDPKLGEKLWTERTGVFRWLVDGLVSYLENGLAVPERVAAATEAYREESDPVGAFLDQCCEVSGRPDVFTLTSELVEAFNWQIVGDGGTAWANRTVQRQLAEKAGAWRDPRSGRTFSAHKRAGLKGYLGLELTDIFRQRWQRDDQAPRHGGRASTAPHPDDDF